MEKITLNELLKIDITGKVICFPTDTVYGVGAKVLDLESIDRIYDMKKRESNKPLAILTATKNIEEYVEKITDSARELINNGWPGALTLIFNKSKLIDQRITKGVNTIAFRMPNSKIALKLLSHFGPMATTSVNLAGEAPLNSVDEIAAIFSDYIDYIVIDKEESTHIPSRVIDVTSDEIRVIR